MKLKALKRNLLLAALALLAPLNLTATSFAAGNASLSFKSNGSTFANGDTFSVTVYENSGSEEINVVQADIAYDQEKLEFTGLNINGSAFDSTGQSQAGNGQVQVSRGITNGTLTGSQKVVTVNFKAIATGSASLSFANTSGVIRASDTQDIWNGSASAATYTISAATTTKKILPLSVTPLSATPIADDIPVSTTSDVTNGGYLIAVQVFDKKGVVITDIPVKLDDRTARTDGKGIASFVGVNAGKHTVKSNGALKTITVVNGERTTVQIFSLTTKRPFSLGSAEMSLILGAFVLGALGMLAAQYFKKRQYASDSGTATVPTDTVHEKVKAKHAHSRGPKIAPAPTVITPEHTTGQKPSGSSDEDK